IACTETADIKGEREGSSIGSSKHAVFRKLLTNHTDTECLYKTNWKSLLLWESPAVCKLSTPLPLISSTTPGQAGTLYHAYSPRKRRVLSHSRKIIDHNIHALRIKITFQLKRIA
ncbi:MAG: hypothetical protein AB2689_23500, partial [Candidatus Thiodiazotropha taylori]